MSSEIIVADCGAAGVSKAWSIKPAAPSVLGQLAAVWRYRHLFWMLAVRQLFHIYRNTILGVAWMAIHPFVIALPAAFVVGNVFGVSVDPLPLPLFIMVGVAAWLLFRRGVQWMTKSMNAARSMLRRVYFPALLLVIATISIGVMQLGVVLLVASAVAIYYGPVRGEYYLNFGWHMLAMPLAMLMIALMALAVSCFTSILNAFARDTWLTLRYILGAWMIATPVVYPMEVVPQTYRWIAYLNPLAAPVELFRYGALGYGKVPMHYLALSAAEILILLFLGIWFFARMQNRLFDHT
jgi:lipopolysaccharide transport system permease protein